tara:strand:- start:83 stop:634 length:552 start_codon:yes stop_codon:yes gene_type:complete
MSKKIEEEISVWLEAVIIGLQLCPFALKPIREARHRIVVSDTDDKAELLADLQQECERLDNVPVESLETTLIVLPNMMQDFYDFNDFLSIANDLLADAGWEGVYQLASFHPRYQFAGTQPDDPENLTNASPYPVIHILREQSVEQAIDAYDDVNKVPERNIQRMNSLTQAERARLFGFLPKLS